MNVLIVYAHPEPQSFNGAMLKVAVDVLKQQGHRVQITDLYAESFQAVATADDFLQRKDPSYLNYQAEQEHAFRTGTLAPDIRREQEKLKWADFVLFQFPLYWFSLPAVLKGWVDRVFTAGFTYGEGQWYSNGKLKGKKAMLSLTTGGTDKMFSEAGINGSIDTILYPINHGILYFSGMEVLPPYVAWSPDRVSESQRALYLREFSQRLRSIETTEPLFFHPLSHYDSDFTLAPEYRRPSARTEEMTAAVWRNDMETVRELLDHGFAVNTKDGSGRTPLMTAAGLGRTEIVRCLLENGADVHILDSVLGASALHFAAQGGSVETAKLLLKYGAHLNLQVPANGLTPLMTAVWHRNKEMVAFLLSQERINLNLRSTFGSTARDLIEAAAVVGGRSGENEERTDEWHALFDAHEERLAARMSYPLLSVVHHRDQSISEEEQLQQLDECLEHHREINAVFPVFSSGVDGHTALMVAARDGLAGAAERLLRAGADMRIVDEYMHATPAHKAAYMGHADVLRVLAKHPDFVEIIDCQGPFNGYTALHDAAWHGHFEAAEVLLRAGANPLLKGHDGCTAYDLAVKNGSIRLAERLRLAMERYKADERPSFEK